MSNHEEDSKEHKDIFVEVTNRQNIANILKSVYNSRECFTIWQSRGAANINSVGFLFDYHGKETDLHFKSMELKSNLGLDKGRELFIHSNFRTLLFKTNIKKINKTNIELEFPTSVRIEETRKEGSRTRLGLKSNQILHIYLYTEEYEKVKVECQILDYSKGGVGLIVPVEFASFLNLHQIVEIGNSNIECLSNRYFAIRSLSPLESVLSGARYIRLGGEFTEK